MQNQINNTVTLMPLTIPHWGLRCFCARTSSAKNNRGAYEIHLLKYEYPPFSA